MRDAARDGRWRERGRREERASASAAQLASLAFATRQGNSEIRWPSAAAAAAAELLRLREDDQQRQEQRRTCASLLPQKLRQHGNGSHTHLRQRRRKWPKRETDDMY